MESQQRKQGIRWKNVAQIVGRSSRAALFLLAAAVLIPAVSSAQDANGRVFGTVYDPQGAVIAAAQVTVTNTATQVVRTAVTDSQGYFQVLALPIGNYKVKAEHTGFRTVISAEQKLLINQALRIDIKMEVGAASETVDVGAEAAPVETSIQLWGSRSQDEPSPTCRSTVATRL